jgi:hypothetical protein
MGFASKCFRITSGGGGLTVGAMDPDSEQYAPCDVPASFYKYATK